MSLLASRTVRTIALTALAAGASGMPLSPAAAQTLFDQVHTLAAATTGVPIEHTFNIATAGTYQVTLTDLGAALSPPAPLASVTLAVSGSDMIVGTPLVGAGTLTLSSLAAGAYTLHVVGTPGNAPGSGPIGIVVTASNQTQVASFQDVIALPGQALPNGEAVLDASFTVPSSGSYTIALNDLQLPQSLATLTAIVVAQGSSTPVVTLPANGAYSAPATFSSGVTYRVLAVGAPGAGVDAGLYSVTVSSGGGIAFARAVPVGATTHLGSPVLAAGSYTLALADLAFPAALTEFGAALVRNGSAVATLTAAGSSASFAAAADTYEVYAVGTANSTAPGAGSYALQVLPQGAGPPVFSVGRGVVAAGSALTPYAFDLTLGASGAQTVNLADFQFPAPLVSVRLAAVQAGALLGTPITGAGTLGINPASGALSLVAFAQAASAGGLFGLEVTPGGGGNPVLEVTQAVGTLFYSQQVPIAAAGSYSVTATDLGFPANFANYDTIVTKGTQQVGSIFGGGTFNFAAAAGTYYVNFLAQPNGQAQAGTYALTVAAAPPAPVVSLSVDRPQITSGGTVNIIWSSQNATSCAASGGWSGPEMLSGSATSVALTSNTTFTLSCTGPGGTTAQSVDVTVTAPSGGGGKGALDTLLLAVLALLVLARRSLGASAGRAPLRRHGALVVAAVAAALVGCGGAHSRFDSHMRRGQEYLTGGDYNKASVEFRNAMQISPKDLSARLMAGQAAEKLGRVRDALSLYQSVVDTAPDNLEARISLARLQVLAGAADQALKTLEPAVARHPDNAKLFAVRAAAKSEQQRFAEAIADANRALELAPADEEAVEVRAGLYKRVGDFPGAIALVGKAVAAAPDSTTLREMLSDLYAASGDAPRAEEQLRALIGLAPQTARYRYLLSSFYARSGDLDQAERVLEETIKTLPKNDEPKLALVEFFAARRSHEQALKALRDFLAHDPQNEDLRLGLGSLLERFGDSRGATETYAEVIRREGTEPRGLIARDRLAAMAQAQGRHADARTLLDEVLRVNSRDSDALLLRGELALADGNPAAAVADLRIVAGDRPTSPTLQRLLADAYVANGQPQLAEEPLRMAMAAAPADMSLRIGLAQLLRNTGHADQSIELLEEGVHAAPGDRALREALVHAYVVKRDFARAATAAQDLKTLAPQYAPGYYLAGLVAEQQGSLESAAREYRQAWSLEPADADALSALANLEVKQGQRDKALTLVKDAVARNPGNASMLNLLGELYLVQGQYSLADETYNRAIAAAPRAWVSYRSLALGRIAHGDTDGAIAAYRAGIQAVPHEPQLVMDLALVYERNGRASDAIETYEKWYDQNRNSQAVAGELAQLLVTYRSDAASLDRARSLTAAFASSDNARLLDANGWVHFKRAEYTEALTSLEKAVSRSPGSGRTRYHLAMAELRLGQKARARQDLEAALSESRSFTGVEDARAALAALRNGSSGG